MLSAVAARKAAQAVRQESASYPVELQTAPETPPPPTTPSSPLNPVSKRKPGAQASNQPRKSKKKKTRHEKPRYFDAEDSFRKQGDIIVVDQDDSDADSGEEEEFAINSISPSKAIVFERNNSSKGDRPWSPSHPVADFSDEDMDVVEDEPFIPTIPMTTPQKQGEEQAPLSTFKPIPDKNIFSLSSEEAVSLENPTSVDEAIVLLVMTPTETLSLLGTYAFTILHGSISLAGVSLNASKKTHHVFAPRCSPIPALRCLKPNETTKNQSSSLIPARIQPFLKSDCAVIALQELITGVEGLGRICRTFDGVFEPSRWHKNDATPDLGLRGMRMLTHQQKDTQPFIVPNSWDKALSAICPDLSGVEMVDLKAHVCLVKGPKKTGKSTFARTLLNHLLTRYQRVAFLECDLGQSEFTPGGMVALNIVERPLFGPPFTHPTIPQLAHYIGSTTPKASPSHYLSSIQALVQSYRLDFESTFVDVDNKCQDDRASDVIPLVVNTMGWAKGLGADLTRQIEDIVEPTDIFEVEATINERGWSAVPLPTSHDDSFGQTNKTIHFLDPIPAPILSNNFSPSDLRNLSILSYFHAVFLHTQPKNFAQTSATSWDTELPLCAQAPYEVDWTKALDKVFLAGAGAEDVVIPEIGRVLNGAVVGLVSSDPGAIDVDVERSTSTSTIPYTQGASIISPTLSVCHGLALIRAISPTSTHMQILTPLPRHLLANCRVMVKGELELPIWGMLDYRSLAGDGSGAIAGVEKGKVPYLQWGKGEGIGAERRRTRRNLMRKGQM